MSTIQHTADPAQRRREWTYLWFAMLPPLAVIAILMFGVWRERLASTDITNKLASLRKHDEPIGNASLTKFFDTRTTRTTTERWQEILASTLTLFGKFDTTLLRDFDKLVPHTEAWNAEEFANQLSVEAQVVLDEIESLEGEQQPAWQPLLINSWETLLPELQESRSIHRLAMNEFRVAYHAGDRERALEALSLMQSVEKAFDWQLILIGELVRIAQVSARYRLIRDSLAADFWRADELLELQKQLRATDNLDQRWQRMFAGERAGILAGTRIAESGDTKSAAIIDFTNFTPFGIAPTHQRGLLDILDKIQSLRGAGTTGHVEASHLLDWVTSNRVPRLSVLSFTSIPFALNTQLSGYYLPSVQSISAAVARTEEERRMTITSLGIKQFQLQEGGWPNSLGELSRVGVAGNEMLVDDFRDQIFGYRVAHDDKEAVLWTSVNGYGTQRSVNTIPPSERDSKDTDHEMRIR